LAISEYHELIALLMCSWALAEEAGVAQYRFSPAPLVSIA
jgi:hypothetical protein